MLIDTHAHIYTDEFAKDIDSILQAARDAQVSKIYMPNIYRTSIDAMHHLADTYPDLCLPMMGLHPCYVKEDYKAQLAEFKTLHDSERTYYGVGEIGLDYYWDLTFKTQQKAAFETQINWGIELDLPIIIHSRDSLDDSIDMVSSLQNGSLSGVFHCFNGTIDQAKKALDCGFYLGLGGVITFKNAKLGDMVKYLPQDRIVLETDSPYLAPHPHRGSKNQSKYIPVIAEKVAEFREESFDVVAGYTTANANVLFKA